MKNRVLLLVFALPFFGTGVWMTYSIGSNVVQAVQMAQWQPVQATLLRAGYERFSGDDSNTYEAYAEYTYEFSGRQYTATRVSISGGADNIGDYQTVLGNELRRSMARSEPVTVYVNAENPSMVIIDRSLRWGLIGFKSIFIFVFGGVGLGLIIFVLRKREERNKSESKYMDSPWLHNDDWQSASIKSSSKTAMYFSWGFAAFWNLISAPLPFVIYSEVLEKNNTLALIGLLFPVVGVGLIVWAVRRTREWNRFGPAPVTLDPFPGSIGGHVGGTINVKLPYDAGAQFSLTLTSLHSFISGSGNNRSRKESAEWQDTQVAHVSSSAMGTRLSFRFDVPNDLQESATEQKEDSYYLWRLDVTADLDGADIDRSYEIPVYARGEQSSGLSGFSIEQARSKQSRIDSQEISELFDLRNSVRGKSLHFPMGRNLLGGFSSLLFGAIFTGVGWFLIENEGRPVLGSIFGGVGLLIVLLAFYLLLNSLDVMKAGGEIRTVRRFLGVPVKQRRMRHADFVSFRNKVSSRTQTGGQHVVHYSVLAVDRTGQEIIVGEGFKGISQANAAAAFVAREFSLVPQDSMVNSP